MYSTVMPAWRHRAVQTVRLLSVVALIASAVAPPLSAQELAPAPAQEQGAATQPPAAASEAPAPAAPAAAPAEAQPTPPAVEAAPSSASAPADATPAAAPAAPAPADVPPATPLAAPEPGQPEALQPAHEHADHGADAAAPGAAPVAKSTDAAHLPRDLSPWNMFMSADIVVKAVMIGLAFASVVTWTVWLAKSIELTWAKRRLIQAFSEINASHSLAEAAQRLGGRKGIVSGLIDLAAIELRLSADVSDKAGIKERVSSRLDGLAAAAGRDMNRGTGVLATIGSTSPFVGLFGTVWGIMNSFIGISEAQTTNLAIVAPGIAEALLATAIGLVAAIPAVIIYNQFARSIAGYRAIIAEASAEVMRLVSRDLDRGYKVGPARAAE
ncbi:tonB-system energizer ExbB [Hyphomicrobium sp. DMF-1]|uniref:tonB-system energizer ExbB n=1 Tax=Hyphomicrobium sp. DMF-1 TaxID=3019544 RepID=UPI0022EBE401|nr:tonB-system energizer ExbB [Hyphomicrobium sp. DMF-1]WBT40472.1 tonB-system energizer ExbB [Hyphomicrobium sp. DMF-1]